MYENQESQEIRPAPKASESNQYIIPLSILVAGALIAGSIYVSRSEQAPITTAAPAIAEAIEISPIREEDHMRGNPEAPLVLVEYSDTECPFCQQFHGTMQKLMEEYGRDGNLAWVYRHFPIPQLHPPAPKGAEALECAAKQGGNDKFWEYADMIFKTPHAQNVPNHPPLSDIAASIGLDVPSFTACLNSGEMKPIVDEQTLNAQESGGQGTPHNVLVFRNGIPDAVKTYVEQLELQLPPQSIVISEDEERIRIGGAFPYEIMKSLIDAALQS